MAKDKESTFFPKSWSIKKIEQKINEALDNIVEIELLDKHKKVY